MAVGVAVALSVTRPGSRRGLPPAVFLVGDSLNVGIEPYLARSLPGWQLRTDDVPGRATAEGIEAMRAAGTSLAPRLLVSLGTNDTTTPPETFRAEVREALALAGRDRCVVWFMIFRGGVPSTALNDVLREEARRSDTLRLVDWPALVRKHPDWLGDDGIHGTASGYAGRAEEAAKALRAC